MTCTVELVRTLGHHNLLKAAALSPNGTHQFRATPLEPIQRKQLSNYTKNQNYYKFVVRALTAALTLSIELPPAIALVIGALALSAS
jgi:hypothetical protein